MSVSLLLIPTTKNSYSFFDFVAVVASESSETALCQKDVEMISLRLGMLCKNGFERFFDNLPFHHQTHAHVAW